jgi:hypothetical protein
LAVFLGFKLQTQDSPLPRNQQTQKHSKNAFFYSVFSNT